MSRKLEGVLVALLFAGLGVGGVVYGARTWMPVLASRHGAGIDAMLNYLLVTVGGLFLVSYLALAYFIWRGSRRTEIGPRFASRRTEVLLSGGPSFSRRDARGAVPARDGHCPVRDVPEPTQVAGGSAHDRRSSCDRCR